MNMSDSTQLVTVEWNGYCSALLSGVWQIFKDQLYADVSLTCHQQSLKVHQLMLAIFFPGLKDSIPADTEMKDNGSSFKELCLDHLSSDKQGDVLRYLVEFAYSGKMVLPENRLGNVLEAAELVGFEGLAQSIRDRLCSKRLAIDLRTSSGTGKALADRAGTMGSSTGPKRSSRKGIPMKLIKTESDMVFGQGSPQHTDMMLDETAIRTIRLQMSAHNVRSVISDGDSGGVGEGADKMSSTGRSDEDVSSSSCDEEEESDSRDCDWLETMPRRKILERAAITPSHNSGLEGGNEQATPSDDVSRWTRGLEALKCSRCDYTGNSEKRFARHCASHDRLDAKRSERFVCSVCSKVFLTSKGCKDHMVFHNPELIFQCKYCAFVTNKKWSLGQHLAIKHRVDEADNPVTMQFQCPECEYTCVASRQLSTHLVEKHPKRQFRCDLCDYTNSHMHRIREHKVVKHGVDDKGNSLEKSLKCAGCDFMCHTRKQMNFHTSKKHRRAPDKQQTCDECGYRTIYRSELRNHVDQVHRGMCRFKCDVCGKRISKRSNYVRHKRSHLGLKPFACSLCGQAFADRHNLRKHDARHATAGDVARPSVVTRSGTAKLAAGTEADLAASLRPSADVPEGVVNHPFEKH